VSPVRVTVMVALLPLSPALKEAAENWMVLGGVTPACVTVKVCPAMVIVPRRGRPALTETE
jgi:hypothetical protein